jgi:TonB-dependent starch-binding outer membrane protein SusC
MKQKHEKLRFYRFYLWLPILLTFCFVDIICAQAQASVNGIVKDDSGQTLPGVTVLIKGQRNGGTVTDINGSFHIEVPNEATLSFSFIGYETKEVPVDNQKHLNVTLATKTQEINDMVVVGYQSIRKKDLTGAVSVVKTEYLQNRASSDIAGALKGLASGIKVTSSGLAGDASSISIRGIGNLTNNDPLFVIDGLPSSGGMDLNMQDVESIQILKDASAAAIYGSRAANGVIIINTKKGDGAMKIDFSTQLTASWLPRYDLMDANEYKHYDDLAYDEAIKQGIAGQRQNHYDANTDWQDEVLKSGFKQNYNLSLSGGNKSGNVFLSINKLSDSGTLYDTSYDRYAFRVNSSGEKGIFSYGENLNYTTASQNGMQGNPFANLISMPPTIPVYDDSHPGGYGYGDPDRANTYALNPIAMQNLNKVISDHTTLQGNLFGQINLFKMLTAKLNFGYNEYNGTTNTLRKLGNWTMGQGTDIPYLTRENYQSRTMLYENTYDFKHTFGKHDVNAIFGISYQHYEGSSHYTTRLNPLVVGDKYYESINAATGTVTGGTGFDESSLISYFGRANYAYANKYLFSATIRRDATSRLAKAHRWGDFPSISGAWRISEEDFFNVAAINDLKIRANYGVLGNCNIGSWDYVPVMNTAPRAIFGSPEYMAIGITQSKLVNQDITWEKKIQSNFGVDASFLNSRLTFSADYFISEGKDLLVALPLLLTSGNNGGNPYVNAASLENKGIEIDLGWKDKVGDLSYGANLNFSRIRNKVLDLGYGQTEYYTSLSKTEIGQPLGSWYLLKKIGIFQSTEDIQNYVNKDGVVIQPNALPGDIKYEDYDGNGTINTSDREILGSPWPKFEMGLSVNAQYKCFDLMIQGFGRFGLDVWNGAKATAGDFASNQNNFSGLQPWTEENKSTTQPRIVFGDSRNSRGDQDRWLEDGSFFRIGEIALGYNLPKELCEKIKLIDLRLGLSLNNIITLTKYSGLDPDFKDNGIFTIGADNCSYPNPRSVLFTFSFKY